MVELFFIVVFRKISKKLLSNVFIVKHSFASLLVIIKVKTIVISLFLTIINLHFHPFH